MSRNWRLFAAALLALAAACTSGPTTPGPTPQPTPTPPAAATGVVSGTVSHVTTGARVSAAQVTVGGLSSTTNGEGAYSIAEVPLGAATLRVTAAGFHTHERAITVEASTTVVVTLTPADAPPPPPPVPTATVHGTVTSATTTLPIEGADIDLVVTTDLRFKTRSDALGQWQVSNVPIGVRAELRIDATGHTSIAQPIDIESTTVTTTTTLTPVTTPPPPPPPGAFSTLVRLVDGFSRGGISGALLTAQGLVAEASAGDGRTTVSAEASDTNPRRVSISAPGYVTRETFLRVPGNEAEIDLIPSGQLVDFDALARTTGRIVRWRSALPLHVDTQVRFLPTDNIGVGWPNGTMLAADEYNPIKDDLRSALPLLTGGSFSSFSGVTHGGGGNTDLMVSGRVSVYRVVDLERRRGWVGAARLEVSGDVIVGGIILLDDDFERGSPGQRFALRAHELGHIVGFEHVGRDSIMRPSIHQISEVTAWDQQAMALAYGRSPGNTSPDVDPNDASVNTGRRYWTPFVGIGRNHR